MILVLTDKMSLRPLVLVKIHSIKHYLPKVIKTESRSDLDLCALYKGDQGKTSVVMSPQSVPGSPCVDSSHLLVHHLLWKWLIKTRESQPSTEVGFKFPLQRHVKKKRWVNLTVITTSFRNMKCFYLLLIKCQLYPAFQLLLLLDYTCKINILII